MAAGDRVRRALRQPWPRFLLRKATHLTVGFAVLVALAFFMVHMLPGDPARTIAGLEAPPEYVEEKRIELGLDRPLLTQFSDFVSGVVRFDFGESFVQGRDVADMFANAGSQSLVLASLATGVVFVAALGMGLLIGSLTWGGRHRRWGTAFGMGAGLFSSMPSFVLAVLLVFVFAVTIELFPIAGSEGAGSLVLPVVALASAPAASLARVVRVESVRVLNEDYIRAARSKRLPGWLLLARHVLPNVMTSILTLGGLLFGNLLGGTIIIENVFARHGVGTVVVDAVLARDYPVVQASAVLLGGAVLLINTTVDVAIALLNPKSLVEDQ